MADPVDPIPRQDLALLMSNEAAMVACDHGIVFDVAACEAMVETNGGEMDTAELRRRWPRLHGTCPKGCGFTGIAYASFAHMIWGDW